MSFFLRFLTLLLLALPLQAQEWPALVQNTLRQAQKDEHYAAALALKPEFHLASDERSYYLVWKPGAENPAHWLVTLHGSNGFATNELALWAPFLAPRNIGIIALQWWLGIDGQSYYHQQEIYREIDLAVQKLGLSNPHMMLHGFSRGSANIYAVKAMDISSGRNLFALTVANAGGAMMDYPPTREINEGRFGEKPFTGTRWITVCGYYDPNPQRDGCPAMRLAANWLAAMGGDVVLALEDDHQGHGALHRNPANAEKVLDTFLAVK